MDAQVRLLLDDLHRSGDVDPAEREAALQRHTWLAASNDEQLRELLAALVSREPPIDDAAELFLSAALARVGRMNEYAPGWSDRLPHALVQSALDLYRQLGPACGGRHHLLRLITQRGDDQALAALADRLVDSPPAKDTAVAEVLTPLFRRRDYDPTAIFPRLLDGLAHLSVAASVLDLANFLTREHRVTTHPGAARRERLEQLLGQFAQRLAQLEENPGEPNSKQIELEQTVGESVALVVSLCDALALIGDPASTGKLYQALELRHRRTRTEAAAALARLGEEEGTKALVELAAEPVARLRVLAYAEELGIAERVPEQFTTEIARAEAELALWLAQPSQFGLPPTRMELLDDRRQAWPGFDEPVACFLFRFTYELGEARFSNVGIAGPLTCTFAADLSSLSVDDLYALFIGWQAEHDDIYRLSFDKLAGAERLAAQRLEQFLHDAGYTNAAPAWLGVFFDQQALVAEAEFNGRAGVAVADQDQILWQPFAAKSRPLGVEEVYNLYKGRKLFEAFNHD